MNPVSEWIAKWADTASKVVQTLAILVAGIWTYQKFIKTEGPSLQPHPGLGSELTWLSTGQSDSCEASFRVNIGNDGKTSFTVESVRIRAWFYDLPEGAASRLAPLVPADIKRDNSFAFLDTDVIKKTKPSFFDHDFRQERLAMTYPPGISRHSDFAWYRIPRDHRRIILFDATMAYYVDSEWFPRWRKSKETFTSAWGEACSGLPPNK